MTIAQLKKRERIDKDAYFTVDPRPVPALFHGCPELLDIITGVAELFCGAGHVAEDLMQHNLAVYASDLIDYGYKNQAAVQDFFDVDYLPIGHNSIISNCVYDRFIIVRLIERALDLLPPGGVLALLLNHRFDAVGTRHGLFQPENGFYARVVLPFRMYLFEWTDDSLDPFQDHSWFIWRKGWESGSKNAYLDPALFKGFDKHTDIRARNQFCS